MENRTREVDLERKREKGGGQRNKGSGDPNRYINGGEIFVSREKEEGKKKRKKERERQKKKEDEIYLLWDYDKEKVIYVIKRDIQRFKRRSRRSEWVEQKKKKEKGI